MTTNGTRYVLAIVLMIILVAVTGRGAPALPRMLSGKMAPWQQVVGTWGCTLHFDAVGGRPAEVGSVGVSAVVAPGNVLHWHFRGSGYEADDFNGYSGTAKVWWEAGADTGGNATLMRSPDGIVFTQVSDSTSSIEGDRSKSRVTYKLNPDNTFEQVEEQQDGSTWRRDSEMFCRNAP